MHTNCSEVLMDSYLDTTHMHNIMVCIIWKINMWLDFVSLSSLWDRPQRINTEGIACSNDTNT